MLCIILGTISASPGPIIIYTHSTGEIVVHAWNKTLGKGWKILCWKTNCVYHTAIFSN